jgi:tRNA(fMet)-specific endonuclease VapC
MQYLLDTDTCVFIARQRPLSVATRFKNHQPGELVMSIINYGELRLGAEKSKQASTALAKLELFIQAVPVLPMEPDVARYYAQLRLYLERNGQMIGNNDLWIASHCLQLGLTLVTNNEREFRRIPNLAIENWTR